MLNWRAFCSLRILDIFQTEFPRRVLKNCAPSLNRKHLTSDHHKISVLTFSSTVTSLVYWLFTCFKMKTVEGLFSHFTDWLLDLARPMELSKRCRRSSAKLSSMSTSAALKRRISRRQKYGSRWDRLSWFDKVAFLHPEIPYVDLPAFVYVVY